MAAKHILKVAPKPTAPATTTSRDDQFEAPPEWVTLNLVRLEEELWRVKNEAAGLKALMTSLQSDELDPDRAVFHSLVVLAKRISEQTNSIHSVVKRAYDTATEKDQEQEKKGGRQ